MPRESGNIGRYQGPRGRALHHGIAWCLEWAALADRAGATVKTLSGGARRRLNMAAGLVYRPRAVLLDEPTVGVDAQSRSRIFEMAERLRNGRHYDHLHHALYGRRPLGRVRSHANPSAAWHFRLR